MNPVRYYIIILTFLLAISESKFLSAQTNVALSERRVALVIGNNDYLMGPLVNPVNDARSMARALRSAGFEVLLRENLSNKTEMMRVIRDFGFKLRKGGVGLFYYAGHGLQVNGYNYLIPVNAVINNETEVEYEAVDAGFVLAQMESAQNRLNIMILDACRNNPFARTFRSANQGLVGMNAPTGSLIAYSTSPGSVAIDGSGVNGLYTEELLLQIRQPNLKIEEVFKNVRAEVVNKSNKKQTPWESSSLIGDFYFNYKTPTTEDPVAVDLPPVTETKKPPPVEIAQTKVKWRAKGEYYWLFINDRDVSKETKPATKGKDLIVYYPANGTTYLLKDYWNRRDNTLRTAEVIPPSQEQEKEISYKPSSSENPLDLVKRGNLPQPYNSGENLIIKWRVTKDYKYYLKVNEKEINTTKCKHKLIGNDLYVFNHETERMFLLKDFRKRSDNRWRDGILVK